MPVAPIVVLASFVVDVSIAEVVAPGAGCVPQVAPRLQHDLEERALNSADLSFKHESTAEACDLEVLGFGVGLHRNVEEASDIPGGIPAVVPETRSATPGI
jgi:hypothetical protein